MAPTSPLVQQVIRLDIQALSAYHVPDCSGFVKLDAMENPYTLPPELQVELGQRLAAVAINRYPVPSYQALKTKIAAKLDVAPGFDLMLGNGSDELISLLSLACAKSGAKVLAPIPGFVMYALSAKIAGMEFIGVPLRADLTLDREAMLQAIATHRPSIVYLAYPNNPTGNLFALDDMLAIIAAVGNTGVVVADEAYHPFARTSMMEYLPRHSNLVIMRTVSKLGLAGLRLGYMTGHTDLLAQIEKVRPPYNVNVLTEAAADFVLDHLDVLDAQAESICAERSVQARRLAELPGVQVYPSAANFLLVRIRASHKKADQVFDDLTRQRILVKNVGKMHSLLEDCLRLTIGTPQENAQLFNAIQTSLTV